MQYDSRPSKPFARIRFLLRNALAPEKCSHTQYPSPHLETSGNCSIRIEMQARSVLVKGECQRIVPRANVAVLAFLVLVIVVPPSSAVRQVMGKSCVIRVHVF